MRGLAQIRVPSNTAHINKDVGTLIHLGTGLGEHLDRRLREFKVAGTYEGFGLVIPEDSLGPLDAKLNPQLDSPGHLRIVFSCLDSKYSDNWVCVALRALRVLSNRSNRTSPETFQQGLSELFVRSS